MKHTQAGAIFHIWLDIHLINQNEFSICTSLGQLIPVEDDKVKYFSHCESLVSYCILLQELSNAINCLKGK